MALGPDNKSNTAKFIKYNSLTVSHHMVSHQGLLYTTVQPWHIAQHCVYGVPPIFLATNCTAPFGLTKTTQHPAGNINIKKICVTRGIYFAEHFRFTKSMEVLTGSSDIGVQQHSSVCYERPKDEDVSSIIRAVLLIPVSHTWSIRSLAVALTHTRAEPITM